MTIASKEQLERRVAELLNPSLSEEAAASRRLELFYELVEQLDRGTIRVAERDANGIWRVNSWIKQAILWGFRYGTLAEFSGNSTPFYDKDSLKLKRLTVSDQVRMVPGGSAVRGGTYLAPGVIIMPPSYINIGAYVDQGSMVDSHVLVGSCAQIGARVHLSAGVQIGGVLEPAGSLPVIIEDDAFIGGSCGVYEGVIVKERAVLASGVILNHATCIFDQVYDRFIRAQADEPLIVPEAAVVVPGSRPLTTKTAMAHQIQISCPVIVKYRDAKTDGSLILEENLRGGTGATNRTTELRKFDFFTDGACKGNPGVGGWGAVICSSKGRAEIYGAAQQTTNNRMELMAVIECFKRLKEPSQVTVTTDSKYVHKGMSEWLKGWIAHGWKTGAGQSVKNRDLWEQLLELTAPHQVNWCWVKGHNDHSENERADFLANLAVKEFVATGGEFKQ